MERSRERAPLRFAVIGAGMSGVLTAIKLREAGYDDFAIYEKADRLGGTWRENTYPGHRLRRSVPSLQLLVRAEPRLEPSLLARARRSRPTSRASRAQRGVMERIRFGAEITRCEFRDGRWQLETKSGRRDEVDVVIAATGVLHHPKLPDIAGLDRFAGRAASTARAGTTA